MSQGSNATCAGGEPAVSGYDQVLDLDRRVETLERRLAAMGRLLGEALEAAAKERIARVLAE